eukprot:679514-Hanusia_phi.AAC.1
MPRQSEQTLNVMDADSLQRSFLSYRSPNTSPRHYRIPEAKQRHAQAELMSDRKTLHGRLMMEEDKKTRFFDARRSRNDPFQKSAPSLLNVPASTSEMDGRGGQDGEEMQESRKERKQETRRLLPGLLQMRSCFLLSSDRLMPGPIKNDYGYQGVIEIRESHISTRGMHCNLVMVALIDVLTLVLVFCSISAEERLEIFSALTFRFALLGL